MNFEYLINLVKVQDVELYFAWIWFWNGIMHPQDHSPYRNTVLLDKNFSKKQTYPINKQKISSILPNKLFLFLLRYIPQVFIMIYGKSVKWLH